MAFMEQYNIVLISAIVLVSPSVCEALNQDPYQLGSTVVVSGNELNDTDRQALLEFKAKIVGDELGILHSWNNSVHFCQWCGVKCGLGRQRLTKLDLRSLKLMGSSSPYIGSLSFLKVLNLRDNSFSQELPQEIGRLGRLRELELRGNFLGGEIPSNISGCSKLTRLLHGAQPASWRNTRSARPLVKLTEVIPESLGQLTNLTLFAAGVNGLSGIVPPSIFNLSMIKTLDISSNQFHGSLPSKLGITMPVPFPLVTGNLQKQQELDLGINSLSGVIPPSLGNLKMLNQLGLNHNNLHGTIPSSLGKCENLVALDLSDNNLSGNLKNLGQLSVSQNRLSGMVQTDGVFENASATWVQGNNKLCGGTPDFQLPSCEGSFGSVYKGVLEDNGTVIATKVLNLFSPGSSRRFMAECKALRNIRHRNLVKILTACSGFDYHGNDFKALVYEFMVNGSLEDWLHPSFDSNESEESVKKLNFYQRTNVAIDVACALGYLHHHCETSIVHCDLKPSNILLDDQFIGHVGDFGLAKFISANTQYYSTSQSCTFGLRGTIGYAPPEYGMGSEVSANGDVYSHSILSLEMFSGMRPTDEVFKEGLNLHNLVKAALRE
ncbi:PREDICTED: putative receptor-like protein kinase At3g47110 [Theobroma cacao]|uniref:non-specific serine/threonine protein kinase n=1 Tax=Theobroma cacao TaxID=3641 RepID=A0AB32WFY8_THECC|nr:PREDICTED: putative receptor-like protein kinase At3g47110 [Theobroma cacao]